MALVMRDSFAREELHRTTVETTDTCDWCGATRKSGRLYEYSSVRDDRPSRPATLRGVFCSAACFRSYHEIE